MFQSLAENLREIVKLMLNYEPSLRPDADQFTKVGINPLLDIDIEGLKSLSLLNYILNQIRF